MRCFLLFITLATLLLSVAAPTYATQPPKPIKPPSIQPHPKPGHPNRYHRDRLPHHVKHAVVSGVAYAIVDDLYYRQQGEYFIYVAPPASENKITVSTGGMGKTLKGDYGKVLTKLPSDGKRVAIDGIEYVVIDGIWHAPLIDGQRYVVVQPQL